VVVVPTSTDPMGILKSTRDSVQGTRCKQGTHQCSARWRPRRPGSGLGRPTARSELVRLVPRQSHNFLLLLFLGGLIQINFKPFAPRIPSHSQIVTWSSHRVGGGWRKKASAIEVDDGARGAKSEILIEHKRSHECSTEDFSDSVSEIAVWYRRHRHRLSSKTISG